jgi:hypothetical protein
LEGAGYKKVNCYADVDAQGHALVAVCVEVRNRRLHVAWAKQIVEQAGPMRTIATRFVAGSLDKPSSVDPTLQEWQQLGYQVSTLVRENGRETAVDGLVQTRMTRVMFSGTPGVDRLVVCTGDGNDNNGDLTFPMLVEYAAKNGFQVRLVFFSKCVRSRLDPCDAALLQRTHTLMARTDETFDFFMIIWLGSLVASRLFLQVEIHSWKYNLSGNLKVLAQRYPEFVTIHLLDQHQDVLVYDVIPPGGGLHAGVASAAAASAAATAAAKITAAPVVAAVVTATATATSTASATANATATATTAATASVAPSTAAAATAADTTAAAIAAATAAAKYAAASASTASGVAQLWYCGDYMQGGCAAVWQQLHTLPAGFPWDVHHHDPRATLFPASSDPEGVPGRTGVQFFNSVDYDARGSRTQENMVTTTCVSGTKVQMLITQALKAGRTRCIEGTLEGDSTTGHQLIRWQGRRGESFFQRMSSIEDFAAKNMLPPLNPPVHPACWMQPDKFAAFLQRTAAAAAAAATEAAASASPPAVSPLQAASPLALMSVSPVTPSPVSGGSARASSSAVVDESSSLRPHTGGSIAATAGTTAAAVPPSILLPLVRPSDHHTTGAVDCRSICLFCANSCILACLFSFFHSSFSLASSVSSSLSSWRVFPLIPFASCV